MLVMSRSCYLWMTERARRHGCQVLDLFTQPSTAQPRSPVTGQHMAEALDLEYNAQSMLWRPAITTLPGLKDGKMAGLHFAPATRLSQEESQNTYHI